MISLRPRLALLILVIAVSAQAKPKLTEINVPPAAPMTIRQARQELVETLKSLTETKPDSVRDVKFTRKGMTFVAENVDARWSGNCMLRFAEMKNLSVVSNPQKTFYLVKSDGKTVSLRLNYDVYFRHLKDAANFLNAVRSLHDFALAPETDEIDFTTFSAEAKIWRDTTPKPEMPREARTFKVLAEDAYRRKDFAAALDAYCDALDKHPMWAEGQYNAALLAAEIEDYELAAQHMRRYLVLAPDAKDASAAEDKLLLWEHKAKE